MYKYIVIFLAILTFDESNAQSINFNFGYTYYFLNQKNYPDHLETSQEINYSLGGSFLKYFKSSSLEIGYYYATKNFEHTFPKPYYIGKHTIITSSYHHYPIIFSQRLFRKNNFNIAASTGMIFIRVKEYNEKTFDDDNNYIYGGGSNIDFTTGLMAQFGLKYSLYLNK